MTNYRIFTREWMRRAGDSDRKPDKGDQFISLWIAFNGWIKSKYGNDELESDLIERVKKNNELRNTFRDLRGDRLSTPLKKLKDYTILDMRYENDSSKSKRYDGSLESLIDVLYQIRCNLFHGRKNFDENKIDQELIHLAYDVLYPLFDNYLREYDDGYL